MGNTKANSNVVNSGGHVLTAMIPSLHQLFARARIPAFRFSDYLLPEEVGLQAHTSTELLYHDHAVPLPKSLDRLGEMSEEDLATLHNFLHRQQDQVDPE